MKRQTQNVRTMVYQYGAVPARVAPVLNEETALAQMRLGRRLWNLLVAIEQVHRAAYRRIMHDENQAEIDRLRARKEAIFQERKLARQAARKRVPTPSLDEESARVKAALAMLVEHQKATAQERRAARQAQLDPAHERAWRRKKKARQAAANLGLYWGTYNAVMASHETALARALKEGGELHFRAFRGEGTVTAQIQGGAEVRECDGGENTLFQMDAPIPEQKWRYARVRIGSDGRAPVWVAIPIVYHRPTEGTIKSVSATRRLVAGKVRWTVNVTTTLPPVLLKGAGAAVAVDIGWRLLPDGVRAGYWQDDGGAHGEILGVPAADVEQFREIERQRSRVDTERDQFLPELVKFLNARELDGEWRAQTTALVQWRSPDRVATLVRWWSDHRLAGDRKIWQAAQKWRRHTLHLMNHWRNLSEQLTGRVCERYRVFAADIAARYQVLILEDFDLRQVAEINPDEERKTTGATYRQMASPSSLRSALVNAARREGLEVRVVPGAYTTKTCHACRKTEEWDQAASVMHRCGHCGDLWDQDRNAAINLLASGRAMPTKNQEDTPGISPLSEDRSQNQGKEAVESTV